MDATLGKEYKNTLERTTFLKENCHACEQKGYMKKYTPEELQGHKEELANTAIEIAEIEAEMKRVKEEYKGRLKPLKEKQAQTLSNIKARAEYVNEMCYRFTDPETKETGYYNADGDLIELRPATYDELQPMLFQPHLLKTGTND